MRTITEAEKAKLKAAIAVAEHGQADSQFQEMKRAHALGCEPCRLADAREKEGLELAREMLKSGRTDALERRRSETPAERGRREAYERFFQPHVELSRGPKK
jgi:hypothetical protein